MRSLAGTHARTHAADACASPGTVGSGNRVREGISRNDKRGGSALSWGTRSGEENRLNRARGIMLTVSMVGGGNTDSAQGGSGENHDARGRRLRGWESRASGGSDRRARDGD